MSGKREERLTGVVDDYKEKAARLSNTCDRIREERDAWKKKHENADSDLKDYISKNKTLEDEICGLRQEIETATAKQKQAEEALQSLREQFGEAVHVFLWGLAKFTPAIRKLVNGQTNIPPVAEVTHSSSESESEEEPVPANEKATDSAPEIPAQSSSGLPLTEPNNVPIGGATPRLPE